jgi:hypothetical protein
MVPEPRDWRERAAELRRMAAETDDPERQRKLLALAERWEQVAAEAEAGKRASPFSSL